MSFSTLSFVKATYLQQISLLPDDSVIGNSFPSGVQWRWWRQTKQEKSDERDRFEKQEKSDERDRFEDTWISQLNMVPSAVIIRQFSSEKCNELSSAEGLIFNFSRWM